MEVLVRIIKGGILMFCPNCEFEIKGEDRKECPVCNGVLIEYSEAEVSSKEPKSDVTSGELENTADGSEKPTFYDLENALNIDDEKIEDEEPKETAPFTFTSEPEPEPGVEGGSVEDSLASVLEKYDSLEEPVTAASEKSKLKRSSKIIPTIAVFVVLIIAAAIAGIFLLKSQKEPSPIVAQLKTKIEKMTDKASSTIVKKEKERAIVKKEAEPADAVLKAKKEIPPKKADTVKEVATVAAKKDVLPSKVEVSKKSTVKKEKASVAPVKKKTSPDILYSIHSSSHKNKEVTISEVNRLKQLGFSAYIWKVTLENGQIWHRVKIGDFSTRREAQKVLNELIKKDPESDSYIAQRKVKSKK